MLNRVLQFVQQLMIDGVVRLHGPELATQTEIGTATAWILASEPEFRAHWPAVPPACNGPALDRAVKSFYRASQLAVFRELGPEEVSKLDPLVTPGSDSAEVIYSVDLVLRFLPDLTRIVRGMNPEDPLLAILNGWGTQWPLSSVGIPDLKIGSIEPILSHPCLSQVYIDRVIETGSVDRLGDWKVAERVRGVIGAFPELNRKLYNTFQNLPTS